MARTDWSHVEMFDCIDYGEDDVCIVRAVTHYTHVTMIILYFRTLQH